VSYNPLNRLPPARVAPVLIRHPAARDPHAHDDLLIAAGPADTQCGFKFFAGPLVRRAAADLIATGFAFDVELIARCRQLGADVVEIPVNWRDVPGSTFSAWRHSLTAFAEMAGIWLALRSESAWTGADTEPATAMPATIGVVSPQ